MYEYRLLKWKPPELNTIDFCVKVTDAGDGHAIAKFLVKGDDDELVPFDASGSSERILSKKDAPRWVASFRVLSRRRRVGS